MSQYPSIRNYAESNDKEEQVNNRFRKISIVSYIYTHTIEQDYFIDVWSNVIYFVNQDG